MASTINGISVSVAEVSPARPPANEMPRRLSAYARPRHLGPGPTFYQIAGTISGADFRFTAERLATIWNAAPVVELVDIAVSGPGGQSGLAVPLSWSHDFDNPGVARFSATYALLGGLNRYRGRLTAEVVRTITNHWSQAGLTRLLLPTGSLYPSDAATDLIVDTPSAKKHTSNWGSQDAAYKANEVASGYVSFQFASGFYGNWIKLERDPAGTPKRIEIPGESHASLVLRATHKRGTVDFDPGAGTIKWTEGGGNRTATITGFDRWSIVSWTPHVAEVSLGNEVYVEVHANGLVRIKGVESKLLFSETVPAQSLGGASYRELNADDWFITSTQDWSISANVLAAGTGHVYIFRDTGGAEATTARMLMKDVRLVLGVDVV